MKIGTRTRIGIIIGMCMCMDIGIGIGIGTGIGTGIDICIGIDIIEKVKVPEEGKMKVVGNCESVSSIMRTLWIGAGG